MNREMAKLVVQHVSCPTHPIEITSGALSLTLSSKAGMHIMPKAEGETDFNTVLIKMDESTNAAPEITLYLSDAELKMLKDVWALAH